MTLEPPQQGYAAPPSPPGYTPPQQGYAPPQQGYAPQAYTPPSQGSTQPSQGYAPPQPGYAPPPQGYAQPAQGYRSPVGPPKKGLSSRAKIGMALGGVAALVFVGAMGMLVRGWIFDKTDASCAKDYACYSSGLCKADAKAKRCEASADADCKSSRACIERGQCTAVAGVCRATSASDCAQATECDSGKCEFNGYSCSKKDTGYSAYGSSYDAKPYTPKPEPTPYVEPPRGRCPYGSYEYLGQCAKCDYGCKYVGGGMCDCPR